MVLFGAPSIAGTLASLNWPSDHTILQLDEQIKEKR